MSLKRRSSPFGAFISAHNKASKMSCTSRNFNLRCYATNILNVSHLIIRITVKMYCLHVYLEVLCIFLKVCLKWRDSNLFCVCRIISMLRTQIYCSLVPVPISVKLVIRSKNSLLVRITITYIRTYGCNTLVVYQSRNDRI